MDRAESYDVVVVGGGHNGLIAACYLASAGRRVAVVERAPVLGGMTHSDFLIPGAPQHVVNTCAGEAIFLRATSIVQDLQLSRHSWKTVNVDPSYVYLHPDGNTIAVWRDPARTAADIRRFSPRDADAYLKFVELLDALLAIALPMMKTHAARPGFAALVEAIRTLIRYRRLRSELLAMVLGTADQVAVERFEHPATIALLLNLASGACGMDEDGGGLAYMLLALLHRVGVGRPVGGMQALPAALNARLRELGGTALTGIAVSEIIVENGRTRGVRLADGRVLEARAVISSCDPLVALRLVTPGAFEDRLIKRVKHAPYNRGNASPLMVHLALSGQARVKTRFERDDGLDLRPSVTLVGLAEDVRQGFRDAIRGDYAGTPSIWIAVPSGWDPTQAPTGQDVAYLYPPAMPVQARDSSHQAVEAAVDATIRQAARFYDGLDSEFARWIETPLERMQRLNVTNGCITHIDFALLRSGPLRPAAGLGGKLPVAGFFFGGAGAHPGGGVSGLPGKLAAESALRFLK